MQRTHFSLFVQTAMFKTIPTNRLLEPRTIPENKHADIIKQLNAVITTLNELMPFFQLTVRTPLEQKRESTASITTIKNLNQEIAQKLAQLQQPLLEFLTEEALCFDTKLISDPDNIRPEIALCIALSRRISDCNAMLLPYQSVILPPVLPASIGSIISAMDNALSQQLEKYITRFRMENSLALKQRIADLMEKGAEVSDNTLYDVARRNWYDEAVILFRHRKTPAPSLQTGMHGSSQMVNLFLENGMKPDLTMLHTSLQLHAYYLEIFTQYYPLLKNTLNESQKLHCWLLAVEANSVSALRFMIKELGEDLTPRFLKTPSFENWLASSAHRLNYDMLEFLFNRGLNLEKIGYGRTLLERAADEHDLRKVTFLIKQGANKDKVDDAIALAAKLAENYSMRNTDPGVHLSLMWKSYTPQETNFHAIVRALKNYAASIEMRIDRRF